MINKLDIKYSKLFDSLNDSNCKYREIKKSIVMYKILLSISAIILFVIILLTAINKSHNNYGNIFAVTFLLLISLRLNYLVRNSKTEITVTRESIKFHFTNEEILWKNVNYISINRIEKSELSECTLKIITQNNIHNIDIKHMNFNSEEIETILSYFCMKANSQS